MIILQDTRYMEGIMGDPNVLFEDPLADMSHNDKANTSTIISVSCVGRSLSKMDNNEGMGTQET